MSSPFRKSLHAFSPIAHVIDPKTLPKKEAMLRHLSRLAWKTPEDLQAYQEILLFLAAHPESETMATLVEEECRRIARFFKQKNQPAAYHDLGFPFTTITTRFSHDLTAWLTTRNDCRISNDAFEEGAQDLNSLLKQSLPPLERDETSAGLPNLHLLDALRVKPADRLNFLLDQFAQFDALPLTKDHLWESLHLWVSIKGSSPTFSRLFNRIPVAGRYNHDQILKKFDHEALFRKKLPAAKPLSTDEQASLSAVIKISLLLTHRETDPATFMDLHTLRLYELERGIAIAIYSMKASRQLPLQSYVGYTLFKNGYPAAYGGSWIFGPRAMCSGSIFSGPSAVANRAT